MEKIKISKRGLTIKIQKQINKNNRHIERPILYFLSTKKEKKQLRAQENTVPLIKWATDNYK